MINPIELSSIKGMKKTIAVLVAITFLGSSLSLPALAAVKAGAKCKVVGQIKVKKNKEFTCIAKGKKLVWRKEAKVVTASGVKDNAEASFQPKFAEVLDCPKSAIPKKQLSLVNFSDYPDDEIINCFNFAVNKIAEVQTDVIMIIYPVGPLLLPAGEVKDNDTHYRGSGFEPVVTADQRDSIASSLERYLEPACGKETAIFEARQISRFAELGGGQQVAGGGGGSDECATKRWMILSIDPDRAGPSKELVTTFFHEVFHTVQASPGPACNYSGAPEDDQFWIHEAGASFFGLEMAAELGNLNSDVVWGDHMRFVSNLLGNQEISSEFEDPGIAEKGSIALRLLAERGQLKTSEVMDGSLFQNCGGQPRAFSPQNIQVAKDYWFDYSEVDEGVFRFSETALTQ